MIAETGGERPCIAGVAYALPATVRSLAELAEADLLESDVAVLEGFGFEHLRIAVDESPYGLGLLAARRLLGEHDVDPTSVDVLIWGGPSGAAAFAPAGDGHAVHAEPRARTDFLYPATRLQYELGLESSSVFAIDQLACTQLFAAIRVARALCLGDRTRRVLCVTAQFCPGGSSREKVLNCVSDAACAVLVDAGGDRNRIVASDHLTKGYYWGSERVREELVASYFPTARHLIERTLERAAWLPQDVDWIIPHNVSLRSWEILLGLLRLPNARLWSHNIARVGHLLSGDNFVNLRDALDREDVQPGQRLLLFSYGFGAHWTALAVEA